MRPSLPGAALSVPILSYLIAVRRLNRAALGGDAVTCNLDRRYWTRGMFTT
jgi:hypothetical protein